MSSHPYEILTPWELERNKLLSWWDMQKFSAARFQSFATNFVYLTGQIEALPNTTEAGDLAVQFIPAVTAFREECEKLALRTSMALADEFIAIADGMNVKDLLQSLHQLQNVVNKEMGSHLFFFVDEPQFYKPIHPFGVRVAVWFPELVYDIDEAGNCIAFDRSTASVFHLMRIMEVGVQRFGTRLGVALTNEKNWQVILDQVNKVLKSRDPKDQQTITIGAVASHLYNVKVTWRKPPWITQI